MDERLQRTAACVRECGADWGVLTAPDSVAYATGHVAPIETGVSPFAGGPTVALIGADGTSVLIASNVEAAAAAQARVDAVALYEGFAWEHPADQGANFRAAVARAVARIGMAGRLAIEPDSFAASLHDLLPSAGRAGDITPALRQARCTKTAAELALLRQAARVASVGQRAFMQAVAPGRSELEVFADIRGAMEQAAGERLAVAGDFLSGRDRTAGASGWPGTRRIAAGDPVLSDLAPRVAGYWGDSCAALTVGPAGEGFQRLFAAAKAALTHAVASVRPGLLASELDRQLRACVARAGFAYPHHSGHGIGTAVHEYPRVVPWEHAVLRAGMVLMVEPAAYDPHIGGARTEWMLHVTPTGCEVLSAFEHVSEVAIAVP